MLFHNHANDNHLLSLKNVAAGQALTIRQPHRKHGTAYAEFVRCAGNGVIVRKLFSSMWNSRWTKPIRIRRTDVLEIHTNMARST